MYSFDYLGKYTLSKEERERLLMSVLKRIRNVGREPLWLQKRRNFRTWNKLEKLYGKGVVRDAIQNLLQLKLIQSQGDNKPFVISERGKYVYERGWIESDINKFANPKYPLFISIAALAVSILGNEYFWKAVKWFWKLVIEILSKWQ